MKKITTFMVVMLILLLGISGTAFAKRHHHSHHKKDTNSNQPSNAGQVSGNAATGVTGQADGASKTN